MQYPKNSYKKTSLVGSSLGRPRLIGITARSLVVGVDVAGAARKLLGILLRIAAEDVGAQARDIQTQVARSAAAYSADGGHTQVAHGGSYFARSVTPGHTQVAGRHT